MKRIVKLAGMTFAVYVAVCMFSGVLSTAALADTCWNHNGSVMRLVAQGNMLGRHSLALTEMVARHELRVLRHPNRTFNQS